MSREGLDREVLIGVFGAVRDRWLAADLSGWAAAHEYYPGVIAALNRSLCTKVVITTKQQRFAAALVRAAGLEVAEDAIYGLEHGKKKDVLRSLAGCYGPVRIHFVEDRLRTLEGLDSLRSEQDLRLYFALWGFNTAAERRQAAGAAGIRSLTLAEFAVLAVNPQEFVS